MLDLHNLFANSFLKKLEIDKTLMDEIYGYKSKIRAHLRLHLPTILKKKTNLDYPTAPKFFIQGSCRYKTINMPAHIPPQQADIDDGCYLPTEDWLDNYKQPRMASKDYFEAVETALLPLAHENHWIVDCSKATCVRIIVSDLVHIDIPLYAIPEKEFQKLVEAREILANDHQFTDSASIPWQSLPTYSVMLAHRKNGWVKSDPREIVEWFDDKKDRYGSQLVRIIRYLKAFRDYRWEKEGPSSLLIMVLTCNALDTKYEGRDDLALLHVCANIPEMVSKDVVNPVDPEEILTNRLRDRENVIRAFQKLQNKLEKAIYTATSPSEVFELLSDEFGDRIIGCPDLINEVTPAKVISSSPAVLSTYEIIRRTRAG